MPRKKSETKKPSKAKAPPVTPEDVNMLITDQQLKDLDSDLQTAQTAIDNAVAKKRARLKRSVDKEHLEPGVYAIYQRIKKWGDDEGAYKLPLLMAMLDKGGVTARFDNARKARMDMGEEESVDEAAEKGLEEVAEQREGNVARPTFGRSVGETVQ